MLKRFLFFASIALISFSLRAQTSTINTLYFMDRIPQYHELNPAFQPKCNVYIGLPVMSAFQMSFGLPFSLNDVLKYNPKIDKLTTFLDSTAAPNAKDNFINNLKDNNAIFTNVQTDLLTFGFRFSETYYFTFGASLKVNNSFNLSRDFFKLALYGIDSTSNYNLKDLGVNSTGYLEFAFGLSNKIDNDWTIGAKAKLLNGIWDFSNGDNTLSIKSTKDNMGMFRLDVNTDMTFNGFIPFMPIPKDSSLKNFKPKQYSSDTLSKHYPIFKSIGFAVDLGAKYTGIDKLSLSASLLDLGYINWNKSDAVNVNIKGNYSFSGIGNFDLFKDSIPAITKKMTDSLLNSFKMKTTSTSYTTMLPTKICLGAEYFPETYISLGLMSISQYYKSTFYQQVVLSANLRPAKMLMLTGSYSIFNNGFSNMGLGLSLRLAPIQFYFVADNIPLDFGKLNGLPVIPYKLQYFNMRFGINFVFGCSGKNKEKDKPFIYE